jgi:hypothetical protein
MRTPAPAHEQATSLRLIGNLRPVQPMRSAIDRVELAARRARSLEAHLEAARRPMEAIAARHLADLLDRALADLS